MRLLKQIAFWLVASVLMAALYMGALGSFYNAFLLAILLLPGAIFLSFLLDKISEETGWQKWLHTFYALLLSLYLEWMGLIVAYWFLFELNIDRIPKLMVNPVFLWMWMLFFVFVKDKLFYLNRNPLHKEVLFEVLSGRKKVNLNLNEVKLIESSNEVCTIHLKNKTIQTRERISQLEERLPGHFLRTHRSFIINSNTITGYTKKYVLIDNLEVPISRKYIEKVGTSLAIKTANSS